MNTLNSEFRNLGYYSKAICFDYHENIHLKNDQIIMVYKKKKSPFFFKLQTFWGIIQLFVFAKKCNVIHVFSDFSFNTRHDDYLMNLFFNKFCSNKIKVVTFLGSEVRNSEIEQKINKFYKNVYQLKNYEYRFTETPEKSIAIQKKFQEYSFKAILNPETIHFVDTKILEIIGIYHHPYKRLEPKIINQSKKLKILHGGTAPIAKGTFEIHKIMDKLIEDGYEIDFNSINGVSHDEFINLLRTADIYIDQVIWGWYGVAAIQAMSIGIPVLCYLGEKPLIHVPKIGIYNTNVITLYNDILNLYNDEKLMSEISKNCIETYNKLHQESVVALNLINIYLNQLNNESKD